MESKVLQGEAQGGLSVLARRQEEVLRSQQQQLQRQRSKDAAKLRQIADMEEAALMAHGKYSSLQASTCHPGSSLSTHCATGFGLRLRRHQDIASSGCHSEAEADC